MTKRFSKSFAIKPVAMKVALATCTMAGALISPHALANLSCEIGSSQFGSSSAIVKDVVIKNSGSITAQNVEVVLTFNEPVNFVKAWGDVKNAGAASGNKVTLSAKENLAGGSSFDFGFKGEHDSAASEVSCQVVAANQSAPVESVKPIEPVVPEQPKEEPSVPDQPQVSEPIYPPSDKCPTSNSGALLVQGFDSFTLGTPAMDEKRDFQREFCQPIYTVAGFGAQDEVITQAMLNSRLHDNSLSDEKRRAIQKEYDDQRGREAAGQINTAQDFVRFEITQDSNSFAGKSLKVLYPNGGNTSSHSGLQYPEHIPGTIAYNRDSDSFEGQYRYQEMYVSYWVKFEDDFQWQGGGKLPGMIAERGFRDPNRDERVNTRLMWREEGALEFYIHSPYLKDKTAGKAYEDRIFWNNGKDFDGMAKMKKGQWHHIEYRMKLNDVVNGKVIANGELEGWLDGKQAAYYNDVTLRGDPSFNINTFFFSTFFGGSSGNGSQVWWPTKDVYAYFDQIEVSPTRVGYTPR